MSDRDYHRALEKLLSLADYERTAGLASPLPRDEGDLKRVEAFLERLGHPQWQVPTIHIAGTKGKGSTAAMIASILEAQGYKTGLFTSPHLHTCRERIRFQGQAIGEEEFVALIERLWPLVQEMGREERPLTTFELLTAMAFYYFRESGAEFQVIEVGLGGRLDATNVVNPRLCIITSLSLDHTDILGDTLPQIAWEKGGIIKVGSVTVTAPQAPEAMAVLSQICQERKARLVPVAELYRWQRGEASLEGQSFTLEDTTTRHSLWIPLLGSFQLENAATAFAAIQMLREQGVAISQEAVIRGLREVRWPGRLEVLQQRPLLVVDGAHNVLSAHRLRESLETYFSFERLILIFGVSSGKNLSGMVEELAPRASIVLATRSRHPKALPTSAVAAAFSSYPVPVYPVDGVAQALSRALEMAREGDLVLASGSLFVAAEVIEAVKGIPPELYPRLQAGQGPGR